MRPAAKSFSYEEHPQEQIDSYYDDAVDQLVGEGVDDDEDIVLTIPSQDAEAPSTPPLLSPLRGTSNKRAYMFFNPRESQVGGNEVFEPDPNMSGSIDVSEVQESPIKVEPSSLGYELDDFNENGYVGTECLSGYLNFGSLGGGEEEGEGTRTNAPSPTNDEHHETDADVAVRSVVEEDEGYVDHPLVINPQPVVVVQPQPVGPRRAVLVNSGEFEENLEEKPVNGSNNGSSNNNNNNNNVPTVTYGNRNSSGSMGTMPMASGRNTGKALVVADSAIFKGSSLEMEDLFSEILRKTGAIYGKQKLMEFLKRTSQYFGEQELEQAINRSVSITFPTLLSDSGHLSRTVWNEKFQAALEITDSTERNERLAALRADFVSTAEFYGRIILAERFLPVYRKSIKPVSLGGVAGGTKYLVQGILYKFAEDVDLGAGRWMYGGDARNDAAAAKACGNELKGLSAVFQACAELDLRVPLMCLVDFSGFRISAQAFLPVGSDTLVYGSRDAGKTILSGKGSPVVVAMMSRLAERLRLEPHVVVDSRAEKHILFGPTDIEVHLGYDGRYYLLDSARLMPPQTPPKNAVRAVFYQLFRPEFLTWYGTPLSPDGYTRFGQNNWKEHNSRLKAATEALLNVRIPEFAKQLTAHDARMLPSLMHSWGINMRFLGYVRSRVSDPDVREAALHEMIARTLQKMLQERLREEMNRIRAPQMSPYLHLVSDFCNMITSDPWFWRKPKILKARVLSKFGDVALDDNEKTSRVSLAPGEKMHVLLSRLCLLCGIQLRSGPRLRGEELNEPFVTSDFTLVPRITEMDIASLALAEQYRKQAKRKLGANKLTLLLSAAEIFSKAAISSPLQLSNRLRWLRVLVSIIRHNIRGGKRHGNEDLEVEFSRANAVLQDCLSLAGDQVPPEALFLESSLNRLYYHQFMTANASAMLMKCLEYWSRSYKLLLASSKAEKYSVHIGLNVMNPKRIERRKTKRWMELLLGLDHLVDMKDIGKMGSILCPIFQEDAGLTRFVLGSLRSNPSKKRIFGFLFHVFKNSAQLMESLREWINEDPRVNMSELTLEFLDDSFVASVTRLCGDRIRVMDLSNCSGITDDVLLLFDRLPNLETVSLRRCHRISDDGLIALAHSIPNVKHLDLSYCVRLTDRSLMRAKLPLLETLILDHCVSITGDFFKNRGFASLQMLDLEECHRLTKSNLGRLSNESFPLLKELNLNYVSAANGQSVALIFKHCPQLQSVSLRNTPVSDKAFRGFSKNVLSLTHLSVHTTDFDDDCLTAIAPSLPVTKLNLKQCSRLTGAGLAAFVKFRPPGFAPMTHLDLTDVPGLSEEVLNSVLCDLPGTPMSWRSLKLRGCPISLATLQSVLSLARDLNALSLSGRSEWDIGPCALASRSLKKLFLEACNWTSETLKLLLSDTIVGLKLRSCPNLGNQAVLAISESCKRLEKLHLVALPIQGDGVLPIVKLEALRKLTLHELGLNDASFAPILQAVMGRICCLSIRDLNVTDATWSIITTWGTNLKSLKISRCPIRNSPNRLMLLPKLEVLHLAASSTPPFDHGETASELNQLRVMTLDSAICSNQAAFEQLGYSRSLQRLIVFPQVVPSWWRLIAEKPIRNSMLSLFISSSPQTAFQFLRGMTNLIEINLRESAARAVFPDVGAVFPLLSFPSRAFMFKSRTSGMSFGTRGRQMSLVRSILNTSASHEMSEDGESSDRTSPDVKAGWALLTEAQLELQLQIARLLLEYGYKVVLVYRSNRSGCIELLDFASKNPEHVMLIKLQELFAEGGTIALERRVEALELVLTGYAGPVGQEEDLQSCSIDFLRRSMQDIPYSVVNVIQLVKPLVMKGKQKLVVVTTSIVGSLSDNFTGRMISLRAATSALNQIVKCFSLEAEAWNGIFVLVSPQTNEEEEAMAVCAAKFVKTVLELSIQDNGTWVDTMKKQIPW